MKTKRGSVWFNGIAGMVAVVLAATIVLVDCLRVRSAQAAGFDLPMPTELLKESKTYWMPVMKGVRFDPASPLDLEFTFDSGTASGVRPAEAKQMIEYFFAGLTIPEKDLWVNLSPYEK